MDKVCFRCGNFTRYYVKGLYRYSKTKYGFCRTQKKLVTYRDACDRWTSNCAKNLVCKKTSVKVLSELLFQIAGIRQALQEEQDANHEN